MAAPISTEGRASAVNFNELHSLMCDCLIEQIKAWKEGRLVEPHTDDEGHEVLVRVFPPALLAQAIKFLKDNGIDSPASTNSKIKTLTETMPDLPGANVVNIR